MRQTFRNRTGRVAVVLAVVAALLSQGCILEKKTIIDVYKFVTPVGKDEQHLVNVMSFGASYCIPAGDLGFNVRLLPANLLLTGLLLQAFLVQVSTGAILSQFDFPLEKVGVRFKGQFVLASQVCVQDGQRVEWYVTPMGAGIDSNTEVFSKFTYREE